MVRWSRREWNIIDVAVMVVVEVSVDVAMVVRCLLSHHSPPLIVVSSLCGSDIKENVL